jgi:3-dehydroquinate synthase
MVGERNDPTPITRVRFPLNTVEVDLGGRTYPIHLIEELPGDKVASVAKELTAKRGGRCLLVTDSNVAPLYEAEVRQALTHADFEVHTLIFEAGEEHKTVANITHGLDVALNSGFSRKDYVVALGGGVVGDMAGLIASLLHRGVPIIQVPTTLLAQIDSSVGGKTAVNHPTGKNLIGAFWQPYAVIASQAVLQTLDPRQVRSGLSEGLKHAIIASPTLLTWIQANANALAACQSDVTAHLVRECCIIKAAIVSEDERDQGVRAVLNFGHTLGHGYELAAGYGVLTHGEAVALGMVLAAQISHILGTAEAQVAQTIAIALKELGLPHVPFSEHLPSIDAVLEIARSDKKGDGTRISFILIEKVGSPLIRELDWSQIEEAFSACQTRMIAEEEL